MALKISLKPNEKLIIGNAVIVNNNCRSELTLLNDVPVLRNCDILTMEEANTASEKLYMAIQLFYLTPSTKGLKLFENLFKILFQMSPNQEYSSLLTDIGYTIRDGKPYKALKMAKKLIRIEKELNNE